MPQVHRSLYFHLSAPQLSAHLTYRPDVPSTPWQCRIGRRNEVWGSRQAILEHVCGVGRLGAAHPLAVEIRDEMNYLEIEHEAAAAARA